VQSLTRITLVLELQPLFSLLLELSSYGTTGTGIFWAQWNINTSSSLRSWSSLHSLMVSSWKAAVSITGVTWADWYLGFLYRFYYISQELKQVILLVRQIMMEALHRWMKLWSRGRLRF
jgi:energy-converting hydrogenase Eha subunit G